MRLGGNRRVLGLAGLLVILAAGAAWLVWPKPASQGPTRVEGLKVTPQAGFARADGPRSFSFPADFGPHNDFQTEWWYYTGNLVSTDGRRFGYQLTFFRRAILPLGQQPTRSSDWAANQVYLAHFTLSDIQANRFQYFERSDRGAAGLAGAAGTPAFQVWLGTWSVGQKEQGQYHLEAADNGVQVALDLIDQKGPILEGDKGYSQKGPESGAASYYFSQTRLTTSGSVMSGGQSYAVSGSSWMDHEFSTSVLSPEQVGWDWFALQLDDGSELMVYTLRDKNGTIDPYSQGMLIAPDGSTRRLAKADFNIEILARWQSPHSGGNYPSAWHVSVPSAQLDLTVKPRMADQELQVSATYWEGAVAIEGNENGKAVTGSGYVELTGYGANLPGGF
jgi:predicted secreted hydrolase